MANVPKLSKLPSWSTFKSAVADHKELPADATPAERRKARAKAEAEARNLLREGKLG